MRLFKEDSMLPEPEHERWHVPPEVRCSVSGVNTRHHHPGVRVSSSGLTSKYNVKQLRVAVEFEALALIPRRAVLEGARVHSAKIRGGR
jgi:hypothetical protein